MNEYIQKEILHFKELFSKQNWVIILSVMIAMVIFDQVTKQYFESVLSNGRVIEVIGDTIRFKYTTNKGIAFGINIIDNRLLFSIFSVSAAIFIFFYLISLDVQSKIMFVAIGLIMGGAIGNIIDRILFGEVIDFIDCDIPDISFLAMDRFPTFNIADSAVSVGLGIILLFGFKKKEKEIVEKV
jgi:signal peptidase II